MKSVIHDWDDEMARKILITCRRSVPSNGALLLVEWALSEPNLPSTGKLMDIVMLAMTGGKERAVEEYRDLLASAGFSPSEHDHNADGVRDHRGCSRLVS